MMMMCARTSMLRKQSEYAFIVRRAKMKRSLVGILFFDISVLNSLLCYASFWVFVCVGVEPEMVETMWRYAIL